MCYWTMTCMCDGYARVTLSAMQICVQHEAPLQPQDWPICGHTVQFPISAHFKNDRDPPPPPTDTHTQEALQHFPVTHQRHVISYYFLTHYLVIRVTKHVHNSRFVMPVRLSARILAGQYDLGEGWLMWLRGQYGLRDGGRIWLKGLWGNLP